MIIRNAPTFVCDTCKDVAEGGKGHRAPATWLSFSFGQEDGEQHTHMQFCSHRCFRLGLIAICNADQKEHG